MKFHKRMILAAALVLTALTLTVTAMQQEQAAMARKLIRLHVVANSDSDYDQTVKLQVRDAVLAQAEKVLQDTENPANALQAALPRLEAAAVQRLRQLGCAHPVTVTLRQERFPRRDYDTFALPAGVYPSLRVEIGEGEGHNWWCVVFPSICLRAVGKLETAAVSAGFTEGEVRMITHPQDYVIRFKILELLQQLQSKLT